MEALVQLTANGLVAGATYAPVALGFGLILGVARFWHFAHGAAYVLAAYAGFVLATGLHLPLVGAIAGAMLGAAALGALFEVWLYRPLRRARVGPHVMLVASLGAYIVLSNLVPLAFGFDVQVLTGAAPAGSVALGYARLTWINLAMLAVGALLFVALLVFVRATRAGRSIRAVISNPEMAEVVGIDVDQVRLLTFILGSALAAPAAVLVAADTGAHPEMGLTATLIAAVSVVVGGLGSLPGAFVGALIVGLAQNVGVWKVSSAWQQAIAFGLLLAFILFRPTGVFGRRLWRSHV